ncbi:MAG: winged helix-turn-helix transcriptional regulator [Anaerolineales bacterium]|nr:winged helix-turn-helix transcriptional regulator [Anaerolineales bacterium]
MAEMHLPFIQLRTQVLEALIQGYCVALVGLSNSGKSYLMREIGTPQAEKEYQEKAGKSVVMIYVDCNRAVAISAQAFYEIVLRSTLERLPGGLPKEIRTKVHAHHEAVTEAGTAFNASLSFNLALTELCEGTDVNICFLLDEFDEVYASLDERALLNLRALKDRFPEQLMFVTATLRRHPHIRKSDFQDEFSEMFAQATFPMPLLRPDEASAMLDHCGLALENSARKEICIAMSGGHLGMLLAVAAVLTDLPADAEQDLAQVVAYSPLLRAECLKIWSQLTEAERKYLEILALDPESGVPARIMNLLEGMGLLKDGEIFSPIFTKFIGARARSAQVSEIGVFLDPDSGDVWVDGMRIPVLTDLEFRLLKLLFERRDKITDKYRIVVTVWGEDYLGEVDDARVEKLVSRLRSKIEPDPSEPRYLITQRGRGYKLLNEPQGTAA